MNDENQIRAAIDRLFTAMRTRDVQSFADLHLPDASGIRVWLDARGHAMRTEIKSNREAVAALAGSQDQWDERISDVKITVKGALATAWTGYDFYLNGEFSHRGVNLFELVKMGGSWIFSNASWTIEADG